MKNSIPRSISFFLIIGAACALASASLDDSTSLQTVFRYVLVAGSVASILRALFLMQCAHNLFLAACSGDAKGVSKLAGSVSSFMRAQALDMASLSGRPECENALRQAGAVAFANDERSILVDALPALAPTRRQTRRL